MKTLLFMMSVVISGTSLSFPAHIKELLRWELKANVRNDSSKRQHKLLNLEHLEIPLKLLDQFEYAPLSMCAKSSFVIKKRGVKYIRWIINPEDTKYAKELQSLLRRLGYDASRYKYYKGYLTASRSLMVFDPDSENVFSVKVSTNHTGGAWQNKGVNRVQVQKAVGVTRYLETLLSRLKYLPHAIILPEPIGWAIQHHSFEQGMVIRSYDRLESNFHYPPGFSVIHETEGRELAKRASGSNSVDPHRYWMKNYASSLGRAVAEFIAATGMSYKSAHSQQFLVELDDSFHPTGRIVMRDFNDSIALKPLLNKTELGRSLLDIWLRKYHENKLYVRFGIFHSSKFKMHTGEDAPSPTWVREVHAQDDDFRGFGSIFRKISIKENHNLNQLRNGRLLWKNKFFKSFEKRFSELTSISSQDLRSSLKTMGGVSTHAVHRYSITSSFLSTQPSPIWRRHALTMQCFQVSEDSFLYEKMGCFLKRQSFLERLAP